MKTGQKDQNVMLGPFDVAKQLLSNTQGSKKSLNERLDAYACSRGKPGMEICAQKRTQFRSRPDAGASRRAARAGSL